ncbi:hypothetical protein DH86_00000116, partial [Scytalidium sp. 3C]
PDHFTRGLSPGSSAKSRRAFSRQRDATGPGRAFCNFSILDNYLSTSVSHPPPITFLLDSLHSSFLAPTQSIIATAMASATLGKRSRSSTDALPRVKRQARGEIFNDENEDPFLTVKSQVRCEIEELSEQLPVVSTPSKRNRGSRRQPLSPSKSNASSIEDDTTNDENDNILQTLTPQTPRHRDVLSKIPPTTPRHRVLVRTKSLTPRTPRTSASPGQPTTVYGQAR